MTTLSDTDIAAHEHHMLLTHWAIHASLAAGCALHVPYLTWVGLTRWCNLPHSSPDALEAHYGCRADLNYPSTDVVFARRP